MIGRILSVIILVAIIYTEHYGTPFDQDLAQNIIKSFGLDLLSVSRY